MTGNRRLGAGFSFRPVDHRPDPQLFGQYCSYSQLASGQYQRTRGFAMTLFSAFSHRCALAKR